MIVVAILGLLAALATVGYRRYVGRARPTEAVTMLSEMLQQAAGLLPGVRRLLAPASRQRHRLAQRQRERRRVLSQQPLCRRLRIQPHRRLHREPGPVAGGLALGRAAPARAGPVLHLPGERRRRRPRAPRGDLWPGAAGGHERHQPALVLRPGRLQPHRRRRVPQQRQRLRGQQQPIQLERVQRRAGDPTAARPLSRRGLPAARTRCSCRRDPRRSSCPRSRAD